jgi:hypothetical protein
MENRYNVVMVLQEKPTFPCICETMKDPFEGIRNGDFELVDSLIRTAARYYHLYIVDMQATIEVGDWVIIDGSFLDKALKVENSYVNNFSQFSKIVASTDSMLGLKILSENFVKIYRESPQGQVSYNTIKGEYNWVSQERIDKAGAWWETLSVLTQTALCFEYFDTESISVTDIQTEFIFNWETFFKRI